jgi:Carbohydrate family 9 binding domain-like
MPLLYRDPSAAPPGDYVVTRLSSAAPGLLNASAQQWRDARAIDWGPERYRTTFQACWDAAALHLRFDAVDTAPWFTMRTRDAHLWEEEVVEIFLDAEGAGVNYAELEINPANVICDLRVERPAPAVSSDTRWDWAGLESAVVPLADAHGTREGWTAIARLPWDGLRSLSPAAAARTPPKTGDAWTFNVFRIKRPGGPGNPEEGAIYAAWSVPEGPSFHVPAAFRPLKFA